MADRYWVGGTGNWNSTNTGNWAASSGGSSGASAPVSGDDVFFDAASDAGGSFTVTVVATGPTIRNLTISGLDQAMILAGSTSLTIQGDISLPASNLTWSHTGTTTLSGGNAQTLTTNGVSIAGSVTVNKAGGTTVTLGSALTIGSTRNLTLSQGGFDAANYSVTAGNLVCSSSNTRTLTMGSGTWTIQDSGTSWNMATVTGLSLNENTSTIVMSSASAKTFSGGGETFYNLRSGGVGVLTLVGNNSFNDWPPPGAAYTYRLTAGSTQTFSSFTLSGTAGNLVTLDTTSAGSAASLSKASGTVSVSYLSIKDSTATGGATWNASNSTNVPSLNSGWNFIAAGVTLTADAGSFALNGQAAGVQAARKLPAAYGAFSLNGQAAGLKYGRKLAAALGSFALNGQPITLTYSGAGPKVMVADAGVFSLSGQTLTLRHNRTVTAGLGAFALDGQSVSLAYSGGYRLGADAGQFALNGQSVGLVIGQFWAIESATSESWSASSATPAVWTVQ